MKTLFALAVGASLQGGDAKPRYWLNTDSGVRHNEGCRFFSSSKIGRFCGPSEGRACRVCGG